MSFVLRYTKLLVDSLFPSRLVFRFHFIGPKQLSACYLFLPLLSQFPSVVCSCCCFFFFFPQNNRDRKSSPLYVTTWIVSFALLEWLASWPCTASSHSDTDQSLAKILSEASLSLCLSVTFYFPVYFPTNSICLGFSRLIFISWTSKISELRFDSLSSFRSLAAISKPYAQSRTSIICFLFHQIQPPDLPTT